MAAITSNAIDAQFDNTALWVGGVAPTGADDTTTLANGATCRVRAGATWEVGNAASPTTPAIRTAGTGGTGSLIVDGTLRVRGDTRQSGNATWRVNAGGVFEGINATTALVHYTGDGTGQSGGGLFLSGTGPGSSRAIMRRGAGSAGFTVNNNFGGGGPYGGGSVEWVWALITLGSASITIDFGGGGTIGNTVRDTIFDGCGNIRPIRGLAFSTTGVFRWQRVTVRNPLDATYALQIDGGNTRADPGVRLLEDVFVSGKRLRVANFNGMTFRRCVTRDVAPEFAGSWEAFEDCLVSNEGGVDVVGSVLRGLRVQESAAGENWHGYRPLVTGSRFIDGVLFDGATTTPPGSQGGDLIHATNPTSATSITVRNCLTTKASRPGGSYGKLVSMLGNANFTFPIIENCTHFSKAANEFGLLGISETYAGRADMVQALRNNITVGLTANSGVLANRDQQSVKDCITLSGISNNVVYRAYNGGTNPPGYWTPTATNTFWTSGTPEAVLDLDPMFVDDTRNLATWYRSIVGGTPGTRAADTVLAIDAICARNDDSGWNPAATIENAYAWIRDGYRPTNPLLKTNVSLNNGGWVGAVEGIIGSNSPGVYLDSAGVGLRPLLSSPLSGV